MMYLGFGGGGAARRALGISVKFVQLDIARNGRRRIVRTGLRLRARIGILDRLAAALLPGDVGDADGAVLRDDVGLDQNFPADEPGVVDDVQAGLEFGAVRQVHADAFVGAVFVGFRCQEDVAT